MGLLKLKKNKKFGYQPRYYKNGEGGNPFEIKQKFDEYRTTLSGNKGLKSKFTNAFDDLKNPQEKSSSKTILIIIGILIFLFLVFIDFDLSIFRLKE